MTGRLTEQDLHEIIRQPAEQIRQQAEQIEQLQKRIEQLERQQRKLRRASQPGKLEVPSEDRRSPCW